MRTDVLGVLAVLAALLLAVGGVAAHDNSTGNGHDDTPHGGTAAEWAAWMEKHMNEHMGSEAADQMQERMGMTYEEMGEHMASHQGSMMDGMMNGMMRGGTSGMGCH